MLRTSFSILISRMGFSAVFAFESSAWGLLVWLRGGEERITVYHLGVEAWWWRAGKIEERKKKSQTQSKWTVNWLDQDCETINPRIHLIEAVEHFLTRWPRYDRDRKILIKNVGVGGMPMEELLGDAKKVKHILEDVKIQKKLEQSDWIFKTERGIANSGSASPSAAGSRRTGAFIM
jgi:hypothetical protein